jgi:heme A synthase
MTPITRPSARPLTEPRGQWLRLLAMTCVLLMLVVVTCSASLRLAQERPGCDRWPGCREAVAPSAAPVAAARRDVAAPWMGSAGMRTAHRVAASAMLPAACALALLALRQRPRRAAVGVRALAMLGLALALAALGIVTPGSRSPWVLLGNQLGGLVLLALAWSAWRGLGTAACGRLRGARAVGLLWLVQAALGALSGAGFGLAPAWLHLLLAAPALLAAFALGLSGWRRLRSGDGLALALVAIAQGFLGLAAMLGAATPALVLMHATVAALGLALLSGLSSTYPRNG